jgi:hypothetical protein
MAGHSLLDEARRLNTDRVEGFVVGRRDAVIASVIRRKERPPKGGLLPVIACE